MSFFAGSNPTIETYPLIVSATDAILRRHGVLCYSSQNVGEFCKLALDRLTAMATASPPQETDRLAKPFEERCRLLPDSLAIH
jgi:hypothetical protein